MFLSSLCMYTNRFRVSRSSRTTASPSILRSGRPLRFRLDSRFGNCLSGMGGNAFTAAGLFTPRMPSYVYQRVLQDVLVRLRTTYSHVDSLLEAPGKVDYGDIDVLVVCGSVRPDCRNVARILGASMYKDNKGGNTVNYAVPWPESLTDSDEQSQRKPSVNEENVTTESLSSGNTPLCRYIQVDVNHNKNIQELQFTKFLHAHGDMWLMIGTMIRPYGLTCSVDGLYIRIPELELWDKKRSRVKLIDDPDRILEYLDLDVPSFWAPFASREECMDYVATCRFYDPSKAAAKDEDQSYAAIKVEEKKYKQRPMFAYWLDVYLPAHRDVAAGRSVAMTRQDVLEEAKRLLGAEFAQLYDQQRFDGMYEQGVNAMWADIRKQIPAEGALLGYAMKGLKTKIMATADTLDDDNQQDALLREVQHAFRDARMDMVKQWSLANWKSIASAQEAIDKEKTRQTLRQKTAAAKTHPSSK